MTSPLFDPFDLAGTKLANRLVMAPMTRNRAAADGVPTDVDGHVLRPARHRRADRH